MALKKSSYDAFGMDTGSVRAHLADQILSQLENVVLLDDLWGGLLENTSPHMVDREYLNLEENYRYEVEYACSSQGNLKRFSGKCPECDTTLQEGMGDMARWAQKVETEKIPEFINIEVNKNLPDSWRS